MKIDYQELQRKLIHLSSIWIVLGLHYLEFYLFIKILHFATILLVFFDYLRYYNKSIANISKKLFYFLLRDHETREKQLTGASFMMISACICCDFFSVMTAAFAMSILIISDSCAAIIGKYCGKNKITKDKTLEGFLGFVVSGFIVALLTFIKFELSCFWLISSVISVIVGGVSELYSSKLKLDDNLVIPISVAITLKIINNQ